MKKVALISVITGFSLAGCVQSPPASRLRTLGYVDDRKPGSYDPHDTDQAELGPGAGR